MVCTLLLWPRGPARNLAARWQCRMHPGCSAALQAAPATRATSLPASSSHARAPSALFRPPPARGLPCSAPKRVHDQCLSRRQRSHSVVSARARACLPQHRDHLFVLCKARRERLNFGRTLQSPRRNPHTHTRPSAHNNHRVEQARAAASSALACSARAIASHMICFSCNHSRSQRPLSVDATSAHIRCSHSGRVAAHIGVGNLGGLQLVN